MEYRIIITSGKKKKNTLWVYKTRERAYARYNLLMENNVVYFPKKTICYGIKKPANYEILLIKEREEDDKNRLIRNDMGQIVEEKSKSDKWCILERNPYYVEETFYVFGYDRFDKKQRFDVKRILKEILFKDIRKKTTVKQVFTLNNKLIIQGDPDDFNLIFCKCTDDATQLHNALKDAVRNTKIKNILFFGKIGPDRIREYITLICEKTGMNRIQVNRKNTKRG